MHQGTSWPPGLGTVSGRETKEQEETQKDKRNRRARGKVGLHVQDGVGHDPRPSPCSLQAPAGALGSPAPGGEHNDL